MEASTIGSLQSPHSHLVIKNFEKAKNMNSLPKVMYENQVLWMSTLFHNKNL